MEHPVYTYMYTRLMFMLSDRYVYRGLNWFGKKLVQKCVNDQCNAHDRCQGITTIAITRVMSSVSDGNGTDRKSLTASTGARPLRRNRKVWLNIWSFRVYVMLVLITRSSRFFLQITPLIGNDNRIINCDEIFQFGYIHAYKRDTCSREFLTF